MGVVLVTGGSRGIGAACCRLAAREGYDVAVNYAGRAEAAEAVAEEVRAQGRRACTIKGDIADPAQVAAMFDEATSELGYIDALVSNAGIINRSAPLMDIPVEEIRRVIDVDLTGHLYSTREAVRRMARSRGGKGGAIVVISSMASKLAGAGGFVPYAAAKGGIDILVEGLGKEAASEGVRVTGLRPGLIDTDIQVDTGIENRIERFGPTVPHRSLGHHGRGGRGRALAPLREGVLRDGDALQHLRRPLKHFHAERGSAASSRPKAGRHEKG